MRAAAANRLAELKDKAMMPTFQKLLKDPSFLVIATALTGMYELDPKATLSFAESIEREQNSMVVNVIAKIYAEQAKANKLSFFTEKLANPDMFDRYALIDLYRDFLSRNEDIAVDKGLPILKKIATEDAEWWVRLNATQAILGLRSLCYEKKKLLEENASYNDASVLLEVHKLENQLDAIKTMLSSIKANEKNEQLLQYYQNL